MKSHFRFLSPLATRWLRLGWLALLLPLAALAAAPGAASDPVFRPGDRWGVIGDSITHAGAYQSYLYLYELTRHPDRPLATANLGLSGNTAADTLGRYDWDIAPFHATVATVMLGMNDLGRPMFMPTGPVDDAVKARNRADYRRNLATLLDRLSADGARVILLSPTPYDDTAVNPANPPVAGINPELRAGTAICRELARERGLPFVDLFEPMLTLAHDRQSKDPAFSLISPDRVHPVPSGHFVMALEFLRQTHASPTVARIVLPSANPEAAPTPENCAITAVTRTAQGVTFDCRENALPFPVPDELATLADQLGFTDAFNRELLVVPDLPAGRYTLAIDGTAITTASAAELAAGINLAAFPATPQNAQAHAVGVLEHERFALVTRLRVLPQWRQFRAMNNCPTDDSPEADARFDALLASWQKEKRPLASEFIRLNKEFKATRAEANALRARRDELARRARAAAQPRSHHFTLTAVPAAD
ncbi:MAG: SGNH/GDSL hydrolase family protein [Opitutaceae bacterium]|nr:SGNH/GDSL hydrolase family protein [Opitutaceae bacterium]